jgi:hypothetical protein
VWEHNQTNTLHLKGLESGECQIKFPTFFLYSNVPSAKQPNPLGLPPTLRLRATALALRALRLRAIALALRAILIICSPAPGG